MLSWKVTNAAILDDTHKPPVTVAVVKQNHGVTLGCVCLALNRGDKGVEGVDKLEINVL